MDHFHYYSWSSKCDYRFFIQTLSAVWYNKEQGGERNERNSWKLHFLFSFDQTLSHIYTNQTQKKLFAQRIGNIIIKKPPNETTIWKFTFLCAVHIRNEWRQQEKKVLGFFRLVDWATQSENWEGGKVGIEIYWNNFAA